MCAAFPPVHPDGHRPARPSAAEATEQSRRLPDDRAGDPPRESRADRTLSRRGFIGAAATTALAVGAGLALSGCAREGAAVHESSAPSKADVQGTADAVATIAEPSGDIAVPAEAVRYDVVDSHLHYLDFLQHTDGFDKLMEALDIAGVSQTVLFGMAMAKQWDENADQQPSYYLSNDSRCYYYSGTDFLMLEEYANQPEEVRKRVFPFVCGVNPNDRLAVDHIKRLVALYPGTIAGIGELMSRHDDLTALTYGEPPHLDHPAFFEIFDYAAEQGFPVLVHHNVTAQSTEEILYLDELKAALAHNRGCKIIWAHVGISRRVEVPGLVDIADAMLAENDNLWIDISWVVYDYYFLDEFPDGYDDGATLDDWVALLEKWPDRFLLGTDVVGHWSSYPDEVVKYYALLDKLTPETADKVCRRNVLGLVKTYE